MRMNIVLSTIAIVIAFVVMKGCKPEEEPSAPPPITTVDLTGTVTDSRTSAPLNAAVVRLTNSITTLVDTTDATGVYSFTLDLGDQDNVATNLQITKNGYQTKTESITLTKGSMVRNITLDVLTTPPPPVGPPPSGYPASIAFSSISSNKISVYGVGALESTTIEYEVRDSSGFPVTIDRQDTVSFRLVGRPVTGGAYVSPARVLSNQAGRVKTIVNSGTISGPLQLVAELRRDVDGVVVASEPVQIIVHGGKPVNFAIGANPFNAQAYGIISKSVSTITAVLGDRYGNPATPSAVYFETTQGTIDEGGVSDLDGFVSVPIHSGVQFSSNGFGTVRAWTLGENGVEVRDSLTFLFTGLPRIDSVYWGGAPTAVVDANTQRTVTFRLYDDRLNPMPKGTSITVTKEGGASAVASKVVPDASLPDTMSPFWTYFSFVLSKDVAATPSVNGSATFTITVTTPRGSASANVPVTVQ